MNLLKTIKGWLCPNPPVRLNAPARIEVEASDHHALDKAQDALSEQTQAVEKMKRRLEFVERERQVRHGNTHHHRRSSDNDNRGNANYGGA